MSFVKFGHKVTCSNLAVLLKSTRSQCLLHLYSVHLNIIPVGASSIHIYCITHTSSYVHVQYTVLYNTLSQTFNLSNRCQLTIYNLIKHYGFQILIFPSILDSHFVFSTNTNQGHFRAWQGISKLVCLYKHISHRVHHFSCENEKNIESKL